MTVTNYQNPLQTIKNESLVKLLLFSVGSLQLALPALSVKKVLNHTPVYGSGLSDFGIAHIDDREITVIDLHKKLFKISQAKVSGQKGFLILARDSAEEFFGVWVGETPTLKDIPLSRLRVLPDSYRRSDTLAIASHVLIIPEQDTSITVFVLDVDRLLYSDTFI